LTCRFISRSTTIVIVIVLALVLASALAAGAAVLRPTVGGPSISTAPELVPRKHEEGTTPTGSIFYRLRLGAHDKLLVRFSPPTGQGIVACVLAPTVGDYSVNDSGCLPYGPESQPLVIRTSRKAELAATIPYAGRFTLALVANSCFGDTIELPCRDAFGEAPTLTYELTAFVSRYTLMTLKAPTGVLGGKPFRVSGIVRGAGRGFVKLARQANGRWLPLGRAAIGKGGAFATTLRLERRGPTQLRALYAGDRDHQASRRVVRLEVR